MADWIAQPKIIQILVSFSVPRTPKQVEKRLNIKKLKMKPFLEKHLLKSLNPGARKARLYVVTNKARRLLKLPVSRKKANKDWDLIGWVMSSPRQRLVVLKVVDSVKKASEDIRRKASRLNPHLSRISTKGILKDLVSRGLVETQIGDDGRRYYWISQKGRLVADDLDCVWGTGLKGGLV